MPKIRRYGTASLDADSVRPSARNRLLYRFQIIAYAILYLLFIPEVEMIGPAYDIKPASQLPDYLI
jgi:hypothetical protein